MIMIIDYDNDYDNVCMIMIMIMIMIRSLDHYDYNLIINTSNISWLVVWNMKFMTFQWYWE